MNQRIFTSLLVIFLSLIFYNQATSQIVAIVGFNGANNDGYSIVALENISGGTVINFTDAEYNAGAMTFDTDEGHWTYTVPAGGLTKGDVVTFTETTSSSNVLGLACNFAGSCGTYTNISGSIAFSGTTTQEYIYAYSDTDTDRANGITEVFAVFVNFGTIPSVDDPSTDFPNSIVVDGFPTGDHRDFKDALRSGMVTKADIESIANYDTGTGNQALSTVPFLNISTSLPIVCPTVGAVSASEISVCPNDPFNVTATGLMNMDMTGNTEQDFGIQFVAFTTTPADPYVGGTSLGTVPFGSLTAGNTTAVLVGASLTSAGAYEIYAILSPAPTDATCRPSAMTTITVNAFPTVTMVIPATEDEYCVDASAQLISFAGSPIGGVYSGPGVIDLLTGSNFTFTPSDAGVGNHTITYTYTNANGCTNSATDNIVVNALPTVTFTALADLCLNSGVQNNLGGGSPTGDGTGVYSGPGVSDDGNGSTYDFDPAAAGVGTHTLTFTFTDGNGCTNSASDDVQVFAVPNAMFTAPADLCLNAGVQNNLGGGTPTGGVYSGPGVSDDGNGMTYDFDPAAAGTGTHTITYTVGVAGCNGSATDDVEVFALPVVSMMIPATEDEYCVDETSAQLISFAGSPIGGAYSGPGVIDLLTGSNFTFTPSVAGVGNHTITYTFTDGNGCTNSATDNIIVNDLPTVTFTALADLCINSGVQNNLGGGSPTGDGTGVYSGSGVSDDGNGSTYDFDPAAAGVGIHTLIFTFTDGNGCTNSASDDVQVFALPTVMFTALADLCINAGVQNNLGGGTPTGGVYSGPGVTDDGNGMTYDFDPAAAGTGTHTITYTVGVAGCSGSAMDDVEVFDLPVVNLSTALGYCIDANVANITLVGGSPDGGVYSGPGVTDPGTGLGYNFDPVVAGVGVHVITYTIVDANGCSNSATSNLEVFNCDIVQSDPCNCLDNASAFDIDNGTGGDNGQFSEIVTLSNTGGVLPIGQTWSVIGASGAFDVNNIPAIGVQSAGVPIATDGSVTLTYNSGVYELPFVHVDAMGYSLTIEGPFGVGSPVNVTLNISNNCSYPNPIFDPTLSNLDLCVEDPAITLGASEPSGFGADGVSFTINGNPETVFDPVALGGGNHLVIMTYDGAADGNSGIAPMGGTAYPGCIQQVKQIVFVDPICCEPPTITCPADNFGLPDGCNPMVPAGVTTFNIVGGATPNPAWPTVADGCDPLALTFVDNTVDVGCTRTVTRTYRITDDNGDFAECDQVFTFTVDILPPVFSEMPPSTTVECDAIPPVPMITATDNCGDIEDVIFINEIHYDNTGSDTGEFLEIAGTAGIDLSNYEVYAYEGSDGLFDAQEPLSGIIPDEGAGFGALAFTRTELPSGFFENGSADGVALVETATGTVIKFISYEGTILAENGPAVGLTSTNIGTEPGNTPVGESLQLIGLDGCPCTDFSWTGPSAESPGLINAGQSFDIAACPSTNEVPVVFSETFSPGTCPQEQTITRTWMATDNCQNPAIHIQIITVVDNTAPEFCNTPMNITVNCGEVPAAEVVTATDNCDFSGMVGPVWINEFHYDNTGADAGEFIEIAGVAGTDLMGYQLVTYNGANGLVDDTYDLTGVITNETCNRGALSFLTPGLQNGSPDGFALIAPDGSVVEFLSYEGDFIAANGPAMGVMSTNVGVSEPGTTPVGFSLQLTGAGASGPDFLWTAPAAASPGSLNTNQEIQGNLVAVLSEMDNTTFCNGGTITRTWNVEDACGNMAVAHVQIITVNPPTPPTLTPPTLPTSLSCEAATAFVAPVATFTNGVLGTCNISGSTAAIVNNSFSACGGTITVTYNDVDQCNNPLVAGPFIITVNPAPVPTITEPTYPNFISCADADVFVGVDATYTNGLTGVCNISGTIPPVVNNSWDACGGTIVVNYSTNDVCGNFISIPPITINVLAAPIPTISFPPLPTSVSCENADSYIPPNASFDNGLAGVCNISGSVSGVTNKFYDACGGVLEVIYFGKDECGRNLAAVVTTIDVDPAPAPTLDIPSYPSSLTCGQAEALVGQFATYSNGLDGVCEIEGFLAPVILKNVDACTGGTVTITYNGQDDCGNILSEPSIIIPVTPATLPTIQLPDDPTSIYCWEAIDYTPGVATFSNGENGFCENSGELTLASLQNFWNECEGGYILYEYDGFDNCGNYLATGLLKVIVNPDTWAPQGECSEIIETIEDIKNTPTPDDLDGYLNIIASNYTDYCNNIITTVIEDTGTPVCGLDGTFERVYTVEISDECGNVAGVCSITFQGNCNPLYCTLSQDFYSSDDEQFGGFTAIGMINELINFGDNPINVGVGECGLSLDNAECIQTALSGAGQSISLPSGFELPCGSPSNNNLVNQIITTTLNVRYNAQLNGTGLDFGNFQLDAACMYIPYSISSNLPDNPTVNDLLDYANGFIGCQCTDECGIYNASGVEANITNILLGLNSRFNQCHIPGPCFLTNETETTEPEDEVTIFPTLGEIDAEVGNNIDPLEVTIFPNPTINILNVKIEDVQGQSGTIEIFDAQGRKVGIKTYISFDQNTLNLDVQKLPSGMYWLSINIEGFEQVSKKFLIKNK